MTRLTEKDKKALRIQTLKKIADTATWDDSGSKTMEMSRLQGLLEQCGPEQLEHSVGNDKYKAPKGKKQTDRVLITNMTSATDCPERKAGHCQLDRESDCYALRAEKRFEKCLAYRRRQAKQWDTFSSKWYCEKIGAIQASKQSKTKLTHHRFNEAGGIEDIKDVLKMLAIAKYTKTIGISTFTYTSNEDLFRQYETAISASSDVVVNGSGFMAHNEYRVVKPGYKAQKNEYWCPDKCYQCKMCKKRLGITILAIERVAGRKAKRNS